MSGGHCCAKLALASTIELVMSSLTKSVGAVNGHHFLRKTAHQKQTEDTIHCNGAVPSSSTTTPTKRRVSASRGAFSGTLKAMDDFELLEVLAQGFFGTVYKVREKANCAAEPIVMKVPIMRDNQQRANNGTPKRDKKVADWEVYMLNELASHPNILKSKGLCVDQTSGHWQLNLLVEFCDRGTLQQAIIGTSACVVGICTDPSPLALAPAMPWFHIVHIARDISDAMAFMHGKGFFHRDLTSMNVLLKSQPFTELPVAVVADFGLATRIPDNPDTKLQQVGTADWKAPEVLSEQYYDEKSDLFSFGIILCQMIGATDADPDKGVFRTKTFGIDFDKFCKQKCPKDVPIDLFKCAKMCCRFRPDKRPSFAALLERFHGMTAFPL